MKGARSRNKVNATGRNETSRFVRLDYRLLQSPAFRSLRPVARALLIELNMLYNGKNNGSIYLSVEDAAARMGVADPHTAATAFDELEARGFIKMMKNAHFAVKAGNSSRARVWRLNWLPGPRNRVSNWAFFSRDPEDKGARKRLERGCKALKAYQRKRDRNHFPDVDFSHEDLE